MQQAAIPLPFWDEIFASVVFLINRLPSSTSTASPYTNLFGKPPDYSILRILGCLCFPYTRPYNENKLQPRSLPCVFLGYCHSQKGYKCLHIPTNKIFISRHVVFDENTFPFKEVSLSGAPDPSPTPAIPLTSFFDQFSEQSFNPIPSSPTDTSSSVQTSPSTAPRFSDRSSDRSSSSSVEPARSAARNLNGPPDRPPDRAAHSPDRLPTDLSLAPSSSSSTTAPLTPSDPPVATTSLHPMITRTRDNTRKPRQFPDHIAYLSTSPELEPLSFTQAQTSPNWRQAMASEIDALARNSTWTLVPTPPNQNIVGCKWVFRIKYNSDGSIARYKARLVAKGFTQEEGVDYFETFSPVVRPTTIRLVLSIAVHHRWTIQQLDVQNAFLHSDLHETVYMQQPPGFLDASAPDHVCLLNKALYGLKQSPRAWYNTLSSALLQFGFVGSQYDPSLFIFSSAGQLLFLLVYVDDLILTGNDPSLLSKVTSLLQQQFAITNLGNLHYFLGIEVSSLSNGLLLTQSKYIMDLLHRTNMHDAKPCASPMVAAPLSKHDGDPMDNPRFYRTVVGALQYVTVTRPDITFAVNKCSQFMHAPTTTHWTAVKRILRYLKGSSSLGLQLQASSSAPLLHAYSDSDWAGSPDDRRSTNGFCIFYGPNLISWSSKKQTTVARSSTEAEYRSLAVASTEVIWLQFLLNELHMPVSSPPILWCDNIGATFLASNPMFHARTKHVEIDYHFIRERVLNNTLSIRFICSKDQLADALTKPLSTPRFLLLRDKLTLALPSFACGDGNNTIMDTTCTDSTGDDLKPNGDHSAPE